MGWLPSAMQARKHNDGRRKRTSRPTPIGDASTPAPAPPMPPTTMPGDRAATNTFCPITGSSHFGVWGWCSKRPGDHGQCRGTTTEHRSSPREPHQPKLARNSDTRTLCSTPKRCNSNGAISTFDIRAGELRATFLRNHNMRCHKNPTQETTQAQQTPTTPTAATSAGALHPIRGATPDKGHCTRTEEVHCLRIGCSAPTHKNKRGTGKANHSPPQSARAPTLGRIAPQRHKRDRTPSMRCWARLVAVWARRPRCHLSG